MSWKHWVAVIAVIGFGIVWQIPRHEEAMTDDTAGHAHSTASGAVTDPDSSVATAREPEPAGPYRTIALEVTGMT